MGYQEVRINSGEAVLAGGSCLANNPKGAILFIAGGGQQPHELTREWQEHFSAEGYSSLAFDFPGVGHSPAPLAGVSLNSRLIDSDNMFEYLHSTTGLSADRIILCGRSMGGPLALCLAAKHQPRKVILLFPAAYATDAYGTSFGEEFTNILRRENSWVNSPDFDLAEKLAGKILVVYGDSDKIIPQPIQDRYLGIGRRKGRAVVIAGAAHTGSFFGGAAGNAERRQKLYETVDEFLSE